MDAITVILPRSDHYWVGALSDAGLDAVKVTADLRCACGGTVESPCTHIEAVKCLQRLEGQLTDDKNPLSVALPEKCPICGGAVTGTPEHWRCENSPGHYWRWRGERTGVRDFLTKPHPAKAGSFYELSIAELEATRDQAHKRMVANGYSPYG